MQSLYPRAFLEYGWGGVTLEVLEAPRPPGRWWWDSLQRSAICLAQVLSLCVVFCSLFPRLSFYHLSVSLCVRLCLPFSSLSLCLSHPLPPFPFSPFLTAVPVGSWGCLRCPVRAAWESGRSVTIDRRVRPRLQQFPGPEEPGLRLGSQGHISPQVTVQGQRMRCWHSPHAQG